MTGAGAAGGSRMMDRLRTLQGAALGLPIAYAGTIALLLCAYIARPALLSPFLLLLIIRQAVPLGIAAVTATISSSP